MSLTLRLTLVTFVAVLVGVLGGMKWVVWIIPTSQMLVADFTIPLPFGGIDVKKGPDGETQVGVGSNVNILGWGGNSGLTFTSKNGSFTTQTQGGILTNGTERGLNSTFGVDKNKGLTADTDLQLGKNKTVHVSCRFVRQNVLL